MNEVNEENDMLRDWFDRICLALLGWFTLGLLLVVVLAGMIATFSIIGWMFHG